MSRSDSQSVPGLAGLERVMANHDVAFAVGLAAILATLLIPLPTFLMDALLSISIAVGLGTLVVVLSARETSELPAFPSLLLLVTLFRLSLNVASTRLILLNGDAGRIIDWFGRTVVGNHMVVGLVVFLIIVIIQFIVITKGSERISEVAARFNLDAMPGKQMAIDADLNAGLIGEVEAKERREKIARESEFYGAMDGASKFVRGDAIAGLVITAVNLVGGFVMGMTRNLSPGQAIETYSILAIGDGLVSQIPAVIISTAAGFLISKTATRRSISQDLLQQTLARSRPLWIASFLFAAMVLVPGLPKVPFVGLALGSGLMARHLRRLERDKEAQEEAPEEAAEPEAVSVDQLLDVDKISIQVGPRLIKVIDPDRKDSVSHRITPLRKKFAQQYGMVLPLVRLRDNLSLDPNTYEIRLFNHVIGSGRLEADRLLAMDPGTVADKVPGTPTREPVFDLPALWIDASEKQRAEIAGYTVVDPESVLVTHLAEVLRRHAYELLSRDDVQELVDRLRDRQPALVNGVIGETVPLALLHRVLQNLLKDGIAIRDLAQILEVLGDSAGRSKDPAVLTELARKSMVRTITEKHAGPDGQIVAITLEPDLEYELVSSLGSDSDGGGFRIAPDRALELVRTISQAWTDAMEAGKEQVVLLCDFRIRRAMANLISRQATQLSVVAYDEIAIGTPIESVSVISLNSGSAPAGQGQAPAPQGAAVAAAAG
jgi:flagellar biosynthesis protein FlhA